MYAGDPRKAMQNIMNSSIGTDDSAEGTIFTAHRRTSVMSSTKYSCTPVFCMSYWWENVQQQELSKATIRPLINP